MPDQKAKPGDRKEEGFNAEILLWFVIFFFWTSLFLSGILDSAGVEKIPYSTFLADVDAQTVDDVSISGQTITGSLKTGKYKRFSCIRVEDPSLPSRLAAHNIKFQGVPEDNFWKTIMSWVMPALVLGAVWMFILNRIAAKGGPGGMGVEVMSIERNRARVYKEDKVKVTFQDVACVDEAKEELQEIIGFL